jgi:hypothetical protein
MSDEVVHFRNRIGKLWFQTESDKTALSVYHSRRSVFARGTGGLVVSAQFKGTLANSDNLAGSLN